MRGKMQSATGEEHDGMFHFRTCMSALVAPSILASVGEWKEKQSWKYEGQLPTAFTPESCF